MAYILYKAVREISEELYALRIPLFAEFYLIYSVENDKVLKFCDLLRSF